MAFNALHMHFIRFLGPEKEPSEFVFTEGLNILWGSSDTGKTFLVQAIDYMLGAGGLLRDIPEKIGYDRILLGLTTSTGKDYTLQRSMNGGAFTRFDGLHKEAPADQKSAKTLSAGHNAKNYTNLSNWLLQEVGLDKKKSFTARRAARRNRSASVRWPIFPSSFIPTSQQTNHPFSAGSGQSGHATMAYSDSC
jgi:hypothetical protein